MRLLKAVTDLETGSGEQREDSVSAHILLSDGGMRCRGRGGGKKRGERERLCLVSVVFN